MAIGIPCYNEEPTVGQVIEGFRRELPDAAIYVFDNGSTDATARVATERGAIVIPVPRPGKGEVVQVMFDRMHGDYHVMVDGDATYPAAAVHALLGPLQDGRADMVVGVRAVTGDGSGFRRFHKAGNRFVTGLINAVWGTKLTDIMSGYRAYSRDIAVSLPLISAGFEIETEMTIQMLDKRLHILEVPIAYGERPVGSASKLRTFRDGARVLFLILRVVKDFKPLTFFGSLSILFALLSGGAFLSITSHAPLRPSGTLLAGAIIGGVLSAIFLNIGLVLHTVNWKLRELYSVARRGQVAHAWERR